MYRLDHLEYQFNFLNDTLFEFQPRFKATTTFYKAKGKKASQKLEKLWEDSRIDDLDKQISEVKLEILNQKLFFVESKLTLLFKNFFKTRCDDNNVKKLDSDIGIDKFISLVIFSKLSKLVNNKICSTKHLKLHPPSWFIAHKFYITFHDKTNAFNPSFIWNNVILKYKCDKLVSKLMNLKKSQELINGFEGSLDTLLGKRKTTKVSKSVVSFSSEIESQDENDISFSSSSKVKVTKLPKERINVPTSKQWEGSLAVSDDEMEESETEINSHVDYNQIDDEEPSEGKRHYIDESNSDREESLHIGQDINDSSFHLPELMTGYISGEEEDSNFDDFVSQEQISNIPKRKNRRGQRARQKIWEKKYGHQAKHIQKQLQNDKNERIKRQHEYEERVAKRAAKAEKQAELSSTLRQEELEKGKHVTGTKFNEVIHPSWQAKKKIQEKLKNVKFQGKKITFN